MTITITPADPASPSAIACLRAYYAELDRTFPGGFDPGPVPGDGLDQMRPPLGVFLMAWDGDRPIACIALRGDGSPTGEVKRLWIAEAFRGQGLATRLMAAAEGHARKLGITALQLDTSRHLPGAVAMYHRLGWTAVPRYNDNPYAHHWFAKDPARCRRPRPPLEGPNPRHLSKETHHGFLPVCLSHGRRVQGPIPAGRRCSRTST